MIYVLGEFEHKEPLLAAARQLRSEGHGGIDIHSPFPIEGADEVLKLRRSHVPLATLISGLSGAGIGYTMQLFCNAIDFPIIVGNRPPHAPPSFVPITFELGVLFAAFGALVSLLWQCRLPELWHPVQEPEQFRSATVDGLWLSVAFAKETWDPEKIAKQLQELGAKSTNVVEGERQ